MAPLLIGLTGGVGCGKSTALAMLRRLGAGTVDLDAIARRLSRPGEAGYRAVRRGFPECLDRSGRLDRRRLADLVFRRPALRRRLEAATHPLILREARRLAARESRTVVVVDVPLLFEAGLGRAFDLTVAVAAPRRLALSRLRARGWSRAECLRRMRSQWPVRRKAAAADVALWNAGTRRALRRRLSGYYRGFRLMAGFDARIPAHGRHRGPPWAGACARPRRRL